MKKEEPLVYDEQGVVYLFSKYWNELKLNITELERVGSRFPDVYYYFKDKYNKYKFGGLEFEYKLSGFNKHLGNGSFKKFNKQQQPESKFIVIYWIDDDKNIKKRLKRKIEFINLSTKFSPKVVKKIEGTLKKEGQLIPYLVFNKLKNNNKSKSLYSFKKIKSKYNSLKKIVKKEYKTINKDYYRILGHNLKKSSDINIEHWNSIHFYTTTSKIILKNSEIPKFIFFKPADKNYISLVIKPKIMFTIKKTLIKRLTNFYNLFYFYPYSPYKPNKKRTMKYVIYDKVHIFSVKEGTDLLRECEKKGKNLGQPSGVFIKKNDERDKNLFNFFEQKMKKLGWI